MTAESQAVHLTTKYRGQLREEVSLLED